MTKRILSRSAAPTFGLALSLLFLSSCDSGGDAAVVVDDPPGADTTPPAFLVAPVLAENANPRAPLAARLSFTTDEPTEALITLDDGDRVWTVTSGPGGLEMHQVELLGVRADRLHTITVEATDGAGLKSTATPIQWTTAPLPSPFPPVTVSVPAAATVQPGLTMLSLRWSPPQPDQEFGGYLVMFDHEGEVVWWYGAPDRPGDARTLSNGNVLYTTRNNGAYEIDMFGETLQWWWADNLSEPPTYAADLGWPEPTRLALDSIHHEMYELPAGGDADFLLLSSEMREITDYPNDELDTTQTDPVANVVADVVAEVTRDGQVVRTWSMFDFLDVYRLSYNSLGGFWDNTYGETRDWTHANAVIPDFANDSFIISMRHQDAVASISRGANKLNWILGDHRRWQAPWSLSLLDPVLDEQFTAPYLDNPFGSPASQFEWQYHQHAPMITQDGNLLLFDNGNGRAVPPGELLATEDRYSRAVIFGIDAEQKTVEGLWEYGSPDAPWYSLFICDADELANGNVLVTDGGEALTGPAGQVGWTRMVEVSTDTPAEVLWELTILDDDPVAPISWNVYRAERLDDIR